MEKTRPFLDTRGVKEKSRQICCKEYIFAVKETYLNDKLEEYRIKLVKEENWIVKVNEWTNTKGTRIYFKTYRTKKEAQSFIRGLKRKAKKHAEYLNKVISNGLLKVEYLYEGGN